MASNPHITQGGPNQDEIQPKDAEVNYLESAYSYGDEKQLNRDATIATEAEHSLSFREAVFKYKKAIGWSLVISASIVMEG